MIFCTDGKDKNALISFIYITTDSKLYMFHITKQDRLEQYTHSLTYISI